MGEQQAKRTLAVSRPNRSVAVDSLDALLALGYLPVNLQQVIQCKPMAEVVLTEGQLPAVRHQQVIDQSTVGPRCGGDLREVGAGHRGSDSQ
jgi:hypothetical protein